MLNRLALFGIFKTIKECEIKVIKFVRPFSRANFFSRDRILPADIAD